MKSLSLAAALVALSLAAASAQENVSDIVVKFERQKAEALQAYLKANPKAEDRLEGLDEVIQTLDLLGEQAAAIPFLEEKYQLAKGGDIGTQLQTLQALIISYRASNDKEKAIKLIDSAPADLGPIGQSEQIKEILANYRNQLNTPSIGGEFEIAFTDLHGKTVDLAAMKGKVVLIDFWATWCGPCVAEMPNVIAAYKKWHDKGFEVVGISLDEDKARLEEFIKEHEMTWPQCFEGKGWQSSHVEKYGISSIPATFLLGKDGKVVAVDLRDTDLETNLSKLLN